MWILDGYNLLFRASVQVGSLERRREVLISRLAHRFAKRDLVIVFDGRFPPPDHTREHRGRIEVIYTPQGMTADAWIVQRVACHSHPHRLTVVSGDRALCRHVACCGARTEDPKEWLEGLYAAETERVPFRPGRPSWEYLQLFEDRWNRMQEGEWFEE